MSNGRRPTSRGSGLDDIEGRNTIIAERFAEDRNDRLAVLARDLVGAGVDVIFAINTPAVLAAKQATTTIPIVVTRVSDPIGAGLVANLARLELLHEALPSTARALDLTIPPALLLRADKVIE